MPDFFYFEDMDSVRREVPDPDTYAVSGVLWGRPEVFFTPAYWMTQYWMRGCGVPLRSYRLGKTLKEEVVACLLGGHGIPAQVGLAAFERLRDRGLIASSNPMTKDFSEALHEPLVVSNRSVTYRFWSQKARYIVLALRTLIDQPAPSSSPRELREYLMGFRGIGPKTSSWIVRNWLSSNEVAILDIHIVRAGRLMKLYSFADRVETRYLEMERRFLNLAAAIDTPAAELDALIWWEMRRTPRLVARLLGMLNEQPRKLSRLHHPSNPS